MTTPLFPEPHIPRTCRLLVAGETMPNPEFCRIWYGETKGFINLNPHASAWYRRQRARYFVEGTSVPASPLANDLEFVAIVRKDAPAPRILHEDFGG